MFVLTLALGLSYLASVLHAVAWVPLPGRIGPLAANALPLAGLLAGAASLAMAVWVGLNYLPVISALPLDYRLTHEFGRDSMPHFGSLFDVRYAASGASFALVLTVGLPDPLWTPARWHVRPLLAAAGFAASGCLAWITGAGLSSLGHGYPLAGAIAGIGLVALALAQLAGYAVASADPVLADAARWLSGSRLRGLLLGAAIAFYGLVLRPLFYEMLWFAALYEWLAVLAATIVVIMKIRNRLKAEAAAAEAEPSEWSGWNRHRQVFEARPDPRWQLMSGLRQRFVEPGEWANLWAYLMGLLYRNEAPPESVRAVFRPLRSCLASPARWNPRGGKGDRNRPRREAALAESLQRAEYALTHALAHATRSPAPVGESALFDAAGPFIQTGADPETLAAEVIAAYRRKGADLNGAVNLWFPLVNVDQRRPRWFEPPWVRGRIRLQARQRRQRLVGGALAHLSGDGTLDSLAVAVTARQLAVFSTPPAVSYSAPPAEILASGQGIELLAETQAAYFVRTSANVEGYVDKSALLRQSILPGDEVKIAQ